VEFIAMTKVQGVPVATGIDPGAMMRGRNPNAHCGNADGWIANRDRDVAATAK
jgi:hypothetical protein